MKQCSLAYENGDIIKKAKLCSKTALPAPYRAVEYIQSSGTQWIDSGLKLTNSNNIKINVNILGSGTQRIFGAFIINECYFLAQQSDGDKLIFDLNYYSHRTISSIVGYETGYHQIEVVNKEFIIDGVSYGVSTGSVDQANYNSYIFGANTNNGPIGGSMQIKDCKIYDNDTLVRNFIPCYNTQTEVIGMYDTVNNNFYTNSGTGTFVKGPDKIVRSCLVLPD